MKCSDKSFIKMIQESQMVSDVRFLEYVSNRGQVKC